MPEVYGDGARRQAEPVRTGGGERLGQGEGALVEGPAHDGAGQRRPSTARAVEGRRSSSEPTPPEAMTGSSVASSTSARPSRSGPARVPSRPISVTIRASTPSSANSRATSRRSRPEPFSQPRTATSRPRASRPTATGMRGREAAHERGLLERGGAEHHPRRPRPRTGRRPRPRRGCRHRSAPGRRPPRTMARDDVAVHRLAGAGGVEIDHVDPRGAGAGEGEGLGDGVVVVDGLAVVVALVEAHGSSVAQVDGGIELHHAGSFSASPGDAAAARPRTGRGSRGRWRRTSRGGTGWPRATPRSTAAATGPP